jgi:hypothetical protein
MLSDGSYEYAWRFVKCTYHTYSLLLKIFPCALYASPVSKSKQSYVTTDSQLASLSWNKAPIWGLRPDLYYCQTVTGLLMRTGLSFARVTVSSNESVVSMYNLHFIHY